MLFKRVIAALTLVGTLTVLLSAAPPATTRSPSSPCRPCAECTTETTTRVIRVTMYNQTRLRESAMTEIVEVANRIWQPYWVTIEAASDAPGVAVILSRGTLRGAPSGSPIAVGDTLFTDGHATPYIHLWLGGAEQLAQNSDNDGRSFTARPPVERDAILERMLGVALAHELGHYLLDISDHSPGGLLRGTLTADDMEHPNPSHLRLTPKQRRLMCRLELGD